MKKTEKKPSQKAKTSTKDKKPTKKKTVNPVIATTEGKKEIIKTFQIKDGDTGSPEVQIALLTNRITKLVNHLKGNPSDNHSRRGLLGIVSKRRRLLNYLEKKEKERFKDIAKKVGLKS